MTTLAMPIDDFSRIGGVKRPLAQLCVMCQNLFDHWPELLVSALRRDTHSGLIEHHVALKDVEAAANNNCGFCIQLLLTAPVFCSRAPEHQGEMFKPSISVRCVECDTGDRKDSLNSPIELSLSLPFPKGHYGEDFDADFRSRLSWIVLEAQVIAIKEQTYLYDDVSGSMSTRDALPVAKLWLEKCSTFHQKCNQKSVQTLPTRLVDLRTESISLRLSEEIEGFPPYATLSHCWGSVPFSSLTKDRLAGFRKHIPRDSLPKTFQDAIDTARYLGIGFLWIDSLCITQDDHEDWAKESSLMASVYGNSYLNIAASFAANATQGCFSGRDNTWKCQIFAVTGGKKRIYECWGSGDNPSKDALSKTILATRGWIVQESILPRRALHFTREQLFWTCTEATCSETFPWGEPRPSISSPKYTQVMVGGITTSNWPETIERYSRTKLTNDSDKLVAIAGLARELQAQTKDQYVVGMWRRSLLLDLFWWVDSPARLIVPYTGPSWSWASLDTAGCRLEYNNPNGYQGRSSLAQHFIEIEDVCIRPKTADPFGAISNATLRLRCQMFSRARLDKATHSRGGQKMTVSETELNVSIYFDTEDTLGPLPRDVYMLYCNKNGSWANCLVLLPVKDCPGRYCRVGIFTVDASPHPSGNGNWSKLQAKLPDIAALDCIEIQEGAEMPFIIDLV